VLVGWLGVVYGADNGTIACCAGVGPLIGVGLTGRCAVCPTNVGLALSADLLHHVSQEGEEVSGFPVDDGGVFGLKAATRIHCPERGNKGTLQQGQLLLSSCLACNPQTLLVSVAFNALWEVFDSMGACCVFSKVHHTSHEAVRACHLRTFL